MNPKRLKSLLVVALGHDRIAAVDLRRAGSQVEVHQALHITPSREPSTDAESTGRELRKAIDAAGIRTRHCLLCVPLGQVLIHRLAIPAIEEADIPGFIELEAERVFPFPPQELQMAVSRFTDSAGNRYATLAAVPSGVIQTYEKLLQAAGLRPVSMTTSTAAIAPSLSGVEGAIGQNVGGLELLLACNGGIVLMRPLMDLPHGEVAIDAATLLRELRITLNQMPQSIRQQLRAIRVFGSSPLQHALMGTLAPALSTMGIAVEPLLDNAGGRVIPGTQDHPATLAMAAAQWLLQGSSTLEFLPRKISRASRLVQSLGSRGMLWKAGAAAAVCLLAIVGAFAWQSWKLSRLQRQWASIESEATELQAIQQKIREYEPWYNGSVGSLDIVKSLVAAFPETGSAWTRTIEIKNMSEVVCSGSAASSADVLNVVETLGKSNGVKDLKTSQIRGEKPVQFAVSYRWEAPEDER